MKRIILLLVSVAVVVSALVIIKNGNRSAFAGGSDVVKCVVEDGNVIMPEIDAFPQSEWVVLKINLSQCWESEDIYSFPYLQGVCLGSCNLCFNIVNNGDELVSAEEEIAFAPSVWAEMSADALQYVSFPELGRKYKRPLSIEKGMVQYPASNSNRCTSKDVEALFKDLTKEDLRKAILDSGLDEDDERYYLKYIKDFKPGAFEYPHGEKYDILDDAYAIILTYKGAEGTYTKQIVYSEIHGN